MSRVGGEWSVINRFTDYDQGSSDREGVEENQLLGPDLNTHYLEIPVYGAVPIFKISEPSPILNHHIWLAAGLYDASVPGRPLHYDSESPTSMQVNLSGSYPALSTRITLAEARTTSPTIYTLRVTTLTRHAGGALASRVYYFHRSPLHNTKYLGKVFSSVSMRIALRQLCAATGNAI